MLSRGRRSGERRAGSLEGEKRREKRDRGWTRNIGGKKYAGREKQRRADSPVEGKVDRYGKRAKRGNRRGKAPTGVDVLCTPVKWPMQIERHRRTMGVHVTINEPINTSFLLFNAFSE